MIILTYTKPSDNWGRGGVSLVGLFGTPDHVLEFLNKDTYTGQYTRVSGELEWWHENDPGRYEGYEVDEYNKAVWQTLYVFPSLPIAVELPVSDKLRNAIPSIDYYYEEATKYDPPSSVGFGDEGSRIIWQGIEAVQYGVYWRLVNQRGRKWDHSSALAKARKAVEKFRKIFMP